MESSWNTFLQSLSPKSIPSYQRWIKQFKEYQAIHSNQLPNSSLEAEINDFFDDLHQSGKATSTLWSVYSIIKSYLLITQSYRLDERMPQLIRLLKNWQKKEEQKKSKVFSRDNVIKFLSDAPDDEKYLVMKASLVVGIHGFLRLSELTEFQFDQIQERPQIEAIQGTIARKKQTGPKANSTFLITEAIFKQKLEQYIHKFKSKVIILFFKLLYLLNLKNLPTNIHIQSGSSNWSFFS